MEFKIISWLFLVQLSARNWKELVDIAVPVGTWYLLCTRIEMIVRGFVNKTSKLRASNMKFQLGPETVINAYS